MTGRRTHVRAVGKCYACNGPVYPHQAVRIAETVEWDDPLGRHHIRAVRRLAHRGDPCEDRVRQAVRG